MLMNIEEIFSREVLEAVLATSIFVLTAVAFVILAAAGLQQQSGQSLIALLLIVLIAVTMLNSVIELRILEAVEDE